MFVEFSYLAHYVFLIDDLIWDEMAVASEISAEDLKELAEGMVALQDDRRGLWSADDVISIFDEITSRRKLVEFCTY